jgi:hypothetical protein
MGVVSSEYLLPESSITTKKKIAGRYDARKGGR